MSKRRRPLSVVLVLTMLAAFLGLVAQPAQAAQLRPFAERYSVNAAGNLVITGNTLMTCPDTAGVACTDSRAGKGSKLNNNDFSMKWVDADSDAGTFNSSSADLLLPGGAPVLFAALYWGNGASGNNTTGTVPSNANTVKFKVPGATTYQTLTADTLDTVGTNDITYSSIKDVTSLVKAAGAGTYSVADVQGREGTNHFAGWSMVVIYADASQPVRAMSVFDGLQSVENKKDVTINVSGFKTPPSGPVNTALGVIAYEGDLGFTGDQLLLNGQALSSPQRPANNFFNSSITTENAYFTAKNPDYINQLGFDAGLVNATGRIANNATSATFKATSQLDQYYPTALTFATELFSPRLDAVKSVSGLTNGSAAPNDVLTYTLALTNSATAASGDISAKTVITDTFPTGMTYVPGSLKVDGASVPDAGGVATISGQSLTVRVGAGASATSGGDLAVGASTKVTYQLKVNGNVPAESLLVNQFAASGTAKTSGFTVTGQSNLVEVPVSATDADVSVIKKAVDQVPTVPGNVFLAGEQASYVIDVSNAGPMPAKDVVVEDTIDAATAFVSAKGDGWTCAFAKPKLTCTRAELPADQSASTITLTVKVPATLANQQKVKNTATVKASTPDPNEGNNSSTDGADVRQVADLAIEKSHTGMAVLGDTITYSLKVTNNGPGEATNVFVKDQLPSTLELVSVKGKDWVCTDAIECTLDNALAEKATAPTITVMAKVASISGAGISNTASVSGSELDPDLSNNSSTDSTEEATTIDIVESVSHTGAAVVGGASVPVSVVAANAGPAAIASGTIVTQTVDLPAGTELSAVNADPWHCLPLSGTGPIRVVCQLTLSSDWKPGTKVPPVVLDVAVTTSGEKVVSATVDTNSKWNEVNQANNTATDSITAEVNVDLALTTTDSAHLTAGGPAKTITWQVANLGPTTESGPVTVDFVVPAGLTIEVDPGVASGQGKKICSNPLSGAGSGGATDSAICSVVGLDLRAGDDSTPLVMAVKAAPGTPDGELEIHGVVSAQTPDANPVNDIALAPVFITSGQGSGGGTGGGTDNGTGGGTDNGTGGGTGGTPEPGTPGQPVNPDQTVPPGQVEQKPVTAGPEQPVSVGTSTLLPGTVQTNAGQAATVRVTCVPRGKQYRGDAVLCRITRSAGGAVKVTLAGQPVTITVRLTAPRKGTYAAMDLRYVFQAG